MRVSRTAKGLNHHNTIRLRKLKVFFQRHPGKHGSAATRGISGVEYELKVGGRVVDKGKTKADGSIELLVPGGQKIQLKIFDTTYDVKIRGSLEKVTDRKGQQRRLTLLGYWLGDVDGTLGRKTDSAILNFQADQALNPDGIAGTHTRGKLKSTFGE